MHKHRHHFFILTHVLLFLLFGSFYNLTGIMVAQEVVNDQLASEPVTDSVATTEQPSDTSPESISSAENIAPAESLVEVVVNELGQVIVTTGEYLVSSTGGMQVVTSDQGLITGTGEILSGEILTSTGSGRVGEVLSGEVLSGEIQTVISGEYLVPNTGETQIVMSNESLIQSTGETVLIIDTGNVQTGSGTEEIILTGDTESLSGASIMPNAIDGLLAWLDAGDLDTLTFSGDQVLEWKDKRGYMKKAFIDDLTRAPILVANTVSSRSALFFDDEDDGMETDISVTAPYTIFVVYNIQKTSISNARVVQGFGDRYLGLFDNKLMYLASGVVSNSSYYGNSNFKIVSLINNLTQSDFFVGGIDATQNNFYLGEPGRLGLGTIGFSQNAPIGGYIAEIIVYDHALSTGYRAKIEEYLGKKYYDLTSHGGWPTLVFSDQEQVTSTGTTEQEISNITGIVEEVTGIAEQTTNPEFTGEVPTVTSTGELYPSLLSPQQVTGQAEGQELLSGGQEAPTGRLEQIPQQVTGQAGIQMLDVFETGYFDHAFAPGEASEQITALQMLLRSLGYFSGVENGAFDQVTMDAVYQFQLAKNFVTPEDDLGLRGYLGPTTRRELNVELQNYEPQAAQNLLFVFDPSTNAELYNNLLAETGFASILSGYQYPIGSTLGLVFDTANREAIVAYLASKGYGTGDVTLVPVDYDALIGDSALDFSLIDGKLLVPIVLQSATTASGQIAEVEIPEGALLKTEDGAEFAGDVMPPVLLDPNTLNVGTDENILSAIDVGSDQHIEFEDGSGNSVNAVFRVPVPGAHVGDIVSISYSEDNSDVLISLDAVEVVDIDGEPYVIFEANHFTRFYVSNNTGGNVDGTLIAQSRSGQTLDASFIIYNRAGVEIKRQGQQQPIPRGLYQAELVPAAGPIKKITFNDLNINADTQAINLDTAISAYADRFSQRYAIDPSQLDFVSGTVTVVATGRDLFKCTAWNFTGQTCNGSWKKIADVLPGQEYTFTLTPDDPGFGENNKKVNVLDKQQTLLNYNENVISNQSGISTVEITPQGLQIAKLKVTNLNENSILNDIIIDTAVVSGSSTTGSSATGVVVLDTTTLAAETISTTLTVAENSRHLLRCELWDDVTESCLDGATNQGWKKEGNIDVSQTGVTLIAETPGKSVWGQSNDDVILLDKGFRVLNFDENIVAVSANPKIKDIHVELFKIKPKAIKLYSYDSSVDNTGLFVEYTPPSTYSINPEEISFEWAEVSTTALGKDLFKCADFDFATQVCLGKWKKLKNLQEGQDYTFILTQQDPSFTETTNAITVVDQDDNLINYTETILNTTNGLSDIEIVPQTGSIEKITIYDHNESGAVNDLKIAEANLSGFVQSYSIDPTGLDFVDANVTAKAQGNVLYKCKDWDFTGQVCYGQWTKLMNIVPGQEYAFTLTPEDPGFGEGTEDITPPTASVEYTPSTLTSGNVFALITGFSESITGLNTTEYFFDANGSFEFTFQDLAGNTGTVVASVTWITGDVSTPAPESNPWIPGGSPDQGGGSSGSTTGSQNTGDVGTGIGPEEVVLITGTADIETSGSSISVVTGDENPIIESILDSAKTLVSILDISEYYNSSSQSEETVDETSVNVEDIVTKVSRKVKVDTGFAVPESETGENLTFKDFVGGWLSALIRILGFLLGW